MPREIEFRGKRTNNGEWMFGTIRVEGEKAYILTDDYSVIFDEPDYHPQGMGCGLEDRGITNRYEACEYGFVEAIEKYREFFPEWFEVEPATVGQFTGLRDSKRTAEYPEGQEIYEGDIVITNKPTYDSEPHKNVVVFENASFRYRCNGINDIPCGCYLSNEVEVIGNIYDNPTLLGGQPDAE